jgi:hypothetical protein
LRAARPFDADLALVDGAAHLAARLYLDRIEADVADYDAWSGLALAGALDPRRNRAWRILLKRPQLPQGVCQAVQRRGYVADTLGIAEWCERRRIVPEQRHPDRLTAASDRYRSPHAGFEAR